jgi:hypothetical protein
MKARLLGSLVQLCFADLCQQQESLHKSPIIPFTKAMGGHFSLYYRYGSYRDLSLVVDGHLTMTVKDGACVVRAARAGRKNFTKSMG